MELLIRAIIAIFEAIFDEDAKRRRQPAPVGKPRPAPPKPGGAGKAEDVLAKLRREMAEAARQARQSEARDARDEQVDLFEQPLEEEHPALPALVSSIQAFDPQALNQPMASSAVQARTAKDFVLPGKTDLERMIWAQVIFSPPPALRHSRNSRIS